MNHDQEAKKNRAKVLEPFLLCGGLVRLSWEVAEHEKGREYQEGDLFILLEKAYPIAEKFPKMTRELAELSIKDAAVDWAVRKFDNDKE